MNSRRVQGSGVWAPRAKKLSYSNVPTIQELQCHLGELYQSSAGGRFDLSFYSNNYAYVLILEYKKVKGIANWKFYAGDNLDSNMIWESDTSDAAIVHNMIMSVIAEALPTDLEEQNSSATELDEASHTTENNIINKDLMAGLQKFLSEVQHKETPAVEEISKDGDLIDLNIGRQAVEELLLNPSGILSFPALLFCLVREYAAANDNRSALSVVLIKLVVSQGEIKFPVPQPVLVTVLDKIKKLQRKTDIIGEYEMADTFAVILPETDLEGSKYFIDRVEKLLAKIHGPDQQTLQMTAAIGVAGGFCNGLPTILGAAERTMAKLEQTGEALGTFTTLFPGQFPPPKEIDFNKVQDLVEKLIDQRYGAFSFPVLVALIEHENNRAKRDKRPLYILVMDVVIKEAGQDDLLEKVMPLLAARISSLQSNSYLLAQYAENSLVVLAPKAQASNLKDFGKQIIRSHTEKPLSKDFTINSYRIEGHLCSVCLDENNPNMARITQLDSVWK